MKISFYLKDKSKIYISVHINGERVSFPSGQKIANKNNFNGKRVIGEEPYKSNINSILIAKERKLKNIESDAILKNVKLTKEYVKREFNKVDEEIIEVPELKIETKDDFFNDFDRFIKNSESGERERESGGKLGKRAVQLYRTTKDHLLTFCNQKKFKLTYSNINKDFYTKFCNYLWDDLEMFDNTVGNYIKALKTFLTWSGKTTEHNKKYFRKYQEEKDIIVLTPEQLNEVIDCEISKDSVRAYFKRKNIPFIEGRLQMTVDLLQRTKDTLIIGCVTTLRVADLLKLRLGYNLVKGDNYKIKVFSSVKTGKFVMIDLPPFACQIIDKYLGIYETILPPISDVKFNENLKTLGEFMRLDEISIGYVRYKRKKPVEIVAPMSDLMTSHIMRRTGITTLLIAGMDPYAVKEISGHSANSKSFSKYIAYSQAYVNTQFKSAWENIRKMGDGKAIMKVS